MNKLPIVMFIIMIFFIPSVLSMDWCEYQEIERHETKAQKSPSLPIEDSTLETGTTNWNGSGCLRVNEPAKCIGDYCLEIATSTNCKIELPFNYCPNMTLSWFELSGQLGDKYNITVCGNTTEYTTITEDYEIHQPKSMENIKFDLGVASCNNYINITREQATVNKHLDNFTISCNYKNSYIGDLNLDDNEWFARPEKFTEYASAPNESYPNVTYKVELNMTDYNPICSDNDNINKYGYYINILSTSPNYINWIPTTQSCIDLGEDRTQTFTYNPSSTSNVYGGCRALVNYQNATMNCDLIKYNTTIGTDIPTMNIILPANDTSFLLSNPIHYSVNMSNSKCKDVYVIATNQLNGYEKLTTLYSTDNYLFIGTETLPNGTYEADFICLDGCVGEEQHNVTQNIGFGITTEWVAGGGVIRYINSTGCMSDWVDLGEKAFCYPNQIDVPSYCSNIEVEETTRVEYDNYITSCDSDGGIFDSSQFDIVSCVPLNNCGEEQYYCNETARTKTKTYVDVVSGIVQGYSEASIPEDCSCPSSLLGIEYGKKVNQFRVHGKLTFECDKSCVGEWICVDTYHKGYLNTDCDLSNITYCPYLCKNGDCVTRTGEVEEGGGVDQVDSATNVVLDFILRPTKYQKFLTGIFISAFVGFLGFSFVSGTKSSEHAGLIFMILFMSGFSFFAFIGYIPSIIIILILFGIGAYVLLKNVGG